MIKHGSQVTLLVVILNGHKSNISKEKKLKKDYIHIKRWIFRRGIELHWFSELGDWFIYLRYKVPLPHMQEIFEIRFSSAGFMKSRYVLR